MNKGRVTIPTDDNFIKETLEIAENIVAQCLYDLIAALVKTKLDSTHRLIDTMKSILMSRMQEAKMSNSMLD